MNKLLLFAMVTAVVWPSKADAVTSADVIDTPPEGRAVEYYADFRNYDDMYGFMGDYHSEQTIVFTDDGKVYIPNLLMRRTMQSYVEGTLDEATSIITVPAGQMVYVSPNISDVTRLYMLDAGGYAGDVDSKEYFTEPLRFQMDADGTLTLLTSEEFPMFGIASDESPEVVYGNGTDLRFIPVETLADKMQYYSYSYVNDADEQTYTTTISGYTSGDDVWFKGLNPHYPGAWVKATFVGDELRAASFQVASFNSSDVPIVMAASKREINGSGEYEYTHYNYLPIAADKDAGTFTACNDDMFMTNIGTWGGDAVEVYQVYKNLNLAPATVDVAVPEDPVFDGYDPSATSVETELKFLAYAKSTNGDDLLPDNLAFRYYVNGEPYVFRKDVYKRLGSDMEVIPWGYNDNNTFMTNSDGIKRYVYFLNADLPAEVSSIGVEVIYTVDGVSHTSRRLVYDVATGKDDYLSGIDAAVSEHGEVESVTYFDLMGRPVGSGFEGVAVKIVRYDNGTAEIEKTVLHK